MAEGLLNDRHGGRYEALSAGTNPRGVHPMAVDVMEEIGIDISHHTFKSVDAVLKEIGVDVPEGAEMKYSGCPLDVVVTVCDDAEKNCPYVPAREGNVHAVFDDPSDTEGTEEEKREAFRRIRDELLEWIDTAFGEPVAE
jgi:arsenate reductase